MADIYDALRKAAAAHRGRGEPAEKRADDDVKSRAMRLADESLRDAERTRDPVMRARHLDAAERAYKLASAAIGATASAEQAGPPTFLIEYRTAPAQDDDDAGEGVEVRAEPEAAGAITH